MPVSATWPTSPLDAAEKAFDMLAEKPTHVPFDCPGFGGLPDKILPLDELRKILLASATAHSVRDAVWRELVIRARRDGPAWRVAAIGIAIPGLRRKASALSEGWHGDSHDLDSELLLGFIERLRTVDLGEPHICRRLIDAGVRAARTLRDADSDTMLVRGCSAGSLMPVRPWDHPDLVLARAIKTAVLDREEARLIAKTRLEQGTLVQVAAELGISPQTASDWRARAEKRLKKAIEDGEVSWVALRARFAGDRDAEARRNGVASLPPRRQQAAARHARDLGLRGD